MFAALKRWLRREPTVTTRLDQQAALKLAREAASGQSGCEDLLIATLDAKSGKPMWVVSAATIGSALVVTIDDESARVVDISRHGMR